MPQKSVVTIQSLACHGKCSITEALPILSSHGLAVSVLPTTVLSTHTGGFGTPVKAEMADFLMETLSHWKENQITFDAVYTGYCSRVEQVRLIEENLDWLCRKNGIVVVDPVMGDNGKLFSGIGEDFSEAMLQLCKKADVIVPNLTEACLLCGIEYKEGFSQEEIKTLLFELQKITNTAVVITGVSFDDDTIGAAVCANNNVDFVFSKRQEQNFHGAGDIFASVVTAGLLKGDNLKTAVKKGVDFVSKAIEKTISTFFIERDGITFEELL